MPHKPSPRERLTRAGLPAAFTDLVLREHAHQLAEQIRRERDDADIPGSPATPDVIRGMTYAANFIDPEEQ